MLVTHTDFDGITCAVLFKAVWPEGEVFFENYDSVNNRLWQITHDYPGAELYITDISPDDPELVEQLEKLNVKLFDHHKTALHFKKYPWATVDTTRCGAALFWFWLYALNHENIVKVKVQRYDRLAWHANDYDTWKHESPLSKDINSLLYILGRDRFIQRFLENPDPVFSSGEQLMLQLEQEKEDRYIQNIIDGDINPHWDTEGRSYALVFAEQYTSQVGHRILERFPTAIDYVAIVNFLYGTVGLRSRKGGVDISEIAKRYGGGGHPGAAGFPLPEGCLDLGWFK